MNRRQFLSYLPLPFLPVSALANGDDEVGIPVEPCPCCCTDDGGVTFYSCDEAGLALPGDPANCEAGYDSDGNIVWEAPFIYPQDSDEPLPVDGKTDNDVSQVVQLPATGSGSSLSPAAYNGAVAEWFWSREDRMMCISTSIGPYCSQSKTDELHASGDWTGFWSLPNARVD
jgi:hypothetical protein